MGWTPVLLVILAGVFECCYFLGAKFLYLLQVGSVAGWGLALRVLSFIPVQNRPLLKEVNLLSVTVSLHLTSAVTLNKVPIPLFLSKLYMFVPHVVFHCKSA